MLLSVIPAFTALLVWPLKPLKAVQKSEIRLGGTATLKCDMSYHHEINWLKLDSEYVPTALMVMGLKNDGTLSVPWNSDPVRFHGRVTERFIVLNIFNLSQRDLGTYFCASSKGKHMEFGEGTLLYIQKQNEEKPSDRNQTSCPETFTFTSSVPSPTGTSVDPQNPFRGHLIIAFALSCGLLLMMLILIAVHIKTSKGHSI